MRLSGHTLGTPNHSLEEALHLFRQAGLDAAEIIVQDGYRPALRQEPSDAELGQVRRWLGELRLEAACLTPYMTGLNSLDDAERDADLARLRRCLAAAERLDCHRVRVYAGRWLPDDPPAEREPRWKRLVEALREVSGEAQRAGVVLCVENHFNTMTVSAADTVALMQAVDAPGVGILYDQANLAFTFCEPFETALPVQAPWIGHVHVKDLVFTDPTRKFIASSVATVEHETRTVRSRVIGDGILPWREIVRGLEAIGYAGYLSFEYEYRWHPQDLPSPEVGFRQSAERMREILASNRKE